MNSSEHSKKDHGFEDLDCYQLARQVLKEAYRVAAKLPQFTFRRKKH